MGSKGSTQHLLILVSLTPLETEVAIELHASADHSCRGVLKWGAPNGSSGVWVVVGGVGGRSRRRWAQPVVAEPVTAPRSGYPVMDAEPIKWLRRRVFPIRNYYASCSTSRISHFARLISKARLRRNVHGT